MSHPSSNPKTLCVHEWAAIGEPQDRARICLKCGWTDTLALDGMNLQQRVMSFMSRMVNQNPIVNREAYALVREMLDADWNIPSAVETAAGQVTGGEYMREQIRKLATAPVGRPSEAIERLAVIAGFCERRAEETPCSAADYEEVLADHRRLVRELDVLLNGEHGAAKQASLCDIVSQLKRQTSDVPTYPIAGDAEARFMLWLMKEMPGGTVISAPSWWSPRIFKAVLRAIEVQEQERPSPVETNERQATAEDRAYCNGARQAAAIAHQSLAALDKWIADGCGNRRQPVNGTGDGA